MRMYDYEHVMCAGIRNLELVRTQITLIGSWGMSVIM